jgi:hypothetical protein
MVSPTREIGGTILWGGELTVFLLSDGIAAEDQHQ